MDELIKDKIEAQNEVKAKEKEEKELVAQQVFLFCFILVLLRGFLLNFVSSRIV